MAARGDVSPPATESSHLPVGDGSDGSCRVAAHSWQKFLQLLSCPGHLAGQLGHHLGDGAARLS